MHVVALPFTAAPVSHWYTNGTFLAIVAITGLAVGILAVVVSVIFYRRGGGPKAVLNYGLSSKTTLIRAYKARGSSAPIAVTVGGEPVKNPVAVTFRLENKSNRDISRAQFEDLPMPFTVDARIVAFLDSNREELRSLFLFGNPRDTDDDERSRNGYESVIEIPPLVIQGKKAVTLSFITEGMPSGVRLKKDYAMPDARLKAVSPEAQPKRNIDIGVATLIGAALTAAALVGFVVLAWLNR